MARKPHPFIKSVSSTDHKTTEIKQPDLGDPCYGGHTRGGTDAKGNPICIKCSAPLSPRAA